MYLKAINATLAAWVVGLFADANIRLGDPQGFLCLRVLLPVLAMGLCILSELKRSKERRTVLNRPPVPYHGAGG